MEEMQPEDIERQAELFSIQTYQNWRLVVPVEDPAKVGALGDKVRVMRARSTEVHTIEQAAIKECDPKGYAVLLHPG